MHYTIGKQMSFEATHRLQLVPEGHKCGRWHGHNYRVEVQLTSSVLDRGMVADFGEVKADLQVWLNTYWDHRMLAPGDLYPDGVPKASYPDPLQGTYPVPIETTAENLAAFLLDVCQAFRWGDMVDAVTVWETDDSWAMVTL